MKRNKKLTIVALVALLLMAFFATLMSFSFANNDNNDIDAGLELADAGNATSTNIDYIIMNSHDDELKDEENVTNDGRYYHIVEISSGGTSKLKDMCTGDSSDFKNYVVDGNATISDYMEAGRVDYTCVKASDISKADDEAYAKLANADLIYVHNDYGAAYGEKNDLPQDVYELIRAYATSEYKPLIIDAPKNVSGGSGGGGTTGSNTKNVIADYYGPMGMYYYTFYYNTSLDADKFFDTSLENRKNSDTKYLAINGKSASANWGYVKESEGDSDVVKSVAHILVVSADGDVFGGSNQIESGATISTKIFGNDSCETKNICDSEGVETGAQYNKLYNISGKALQTKAYNARYNTSPDYVNVEQVKLQEFGSTDYSKYDMIIFESDCNNQTIDEATYNKMVSAMYGKKHVIYDKTMLDGASTTPTTPAGPGSSKVSNYDEFYTDIIDGTGKSSYTNIYITNPTDFNRICESKSADTCKVIAELINVSTYRGIKAGGGSSSSTMFTVLEIQPGYPIDTALATKAEKKNYNTSINSSNPYYHSLQDEKEDRQNGAYYDYMCNIVNNKTVDEISADPDNNMIEYYDWDLSKAELAEALDLDASQINIVHMSSEEFRCNKQDLIGNYDMVYIGGNMSSRATAGDYRSIFNFSYGNLLSRRNGNYADLPVYTMYSHSGDIEVLNLAFLTSDGTRIATSGTPYAKSEFDNGQAWENKTMLLMNGNDISYNNYEDLRDYIDAGFPVVVDKDVTNARTSVENFGYMQNVIDPDSNMYRFLAYAKSNTINVVHGFDPALTEQIATYDQLGSTLTGNTTIFKGDSRKNIRELMNNAKVTKRPKLAVISAPKIYNSYDSESKLDSGNFVFKFEVAGSSSYTVNFYVDDNGNSLFNDDAMLAGSTQAFTSNGDIQKYEISVGDYSGPVYWKFEVVDDSTGGSTYTTGLSFIAPKDEPKQVKVLQIVPATCPNGNQVDGPQGVNSLYFCMDCQRAYKRLNYNPSLDTGVRTNSSAQYSGNYDNAKNPNGYNCGIYYGHHKHTFGIPKYDKTLPVQEGGRPTSTIGCDDWDVNLADEVSDLYNFDIDIMTTREFEAAADEVGKEYPVNIEDAQKKAKIEAHKKELSSKEDDYVLARSNTADKEEILVGILTRMAENGSAKTDMCNTGNTYSEEFLRLIELKCYYEFFNLKGGNSYNKGVFNKYMAAGDDYEKAYDEYARAVDAELEAKAAYQKEFRLANPDNWLKEYYSTVILGPSEAFAGDDIKSAEALAQIKLYVSKNGQLIFFHDTLSRFKDSGAANLTNAFMNTFGLDKNNMEVDTSLANTNTWYVPMKAKNGDDERYYMTNLSYKDNTDNSRYASWSSDYGFGSWETPKYLSPYTYTNAYFLANYNKERSSQYKYAKNYHYAMAALWDNDAKDVAGSGTDKAAQNNMGIITQYPFTLGDNINISGTHVQAYPVDIEKDDLTVWYTLGAGTTAKSKNNNAIFAASPKDGVNNYFIYSYGSVYYCGAGHTKVTGIGKDNNDERRLYLNIICNSVRPSIAQPAINVYDYGTKQNKAIVKDTAKNEYVYKIADDVKYPIFSYLATLDEDDEIVQVDIYYKRDISTGNAFIDNPTTGDFKIITLDGKTSPAGKLINIGTDIATLELKDAYFESSGGKYAYIVIKVTTKNSTTPKYVRIRIEKKDKLHNLT